MTRRGLIRWVAALLIAIPSRSIASEIQFAANGDDSVEAVIGRTVDRIRKDIERGGAKVPDAALVRSKQVGIEAAQQSIARQKKFERKLLDLLVRIHGSIVSIDIEKDAMVVRAVETHASVPMQFTAVTVTNDTAIKKAEGFISFQDLNIGDQVDVYYSAVERTAQAIAVTKSGTR
jgi:hypothetical protein